MSPYTKKLFIKKWQPILEEYEKIKKAVKFGVTHIAENKVQGLKKRF